MANRHYKALELDKILSMCASYAVSEESKTRIRELTPATTFQGAQKYISETHAANSLSIRFGNPGIYAVKPMKDSLRRAERGAMLSPRELLDLAGILRAARALDKWYRQAAERPTALDSHFQALSPNEDLEKEITRCILAEDEIADNASTELSDIRRKIRNANQRARDVLERMTRSTTTQKYLQDPIVTIRNGRFVLPVRSEHRQQVKGLVHDTSASGSTLFIEPMTVVELNNSIKELEAAQQNEINRILLALSAECAEDSDSILSNYDVVLEIDSIFAKSRLGDQMKATIPTLTPTGKTHLRQARHPLIAPDKIVPIDIYVGDEFDTLVVTGPNTGGKTVALKTMGLLTLMAMCGLMIPAGARSTVCYYEQVLADIGDEQSIEQSLSTFSGHMTNIVSILQRAKENALVLIDELGAGTDPVEGAALAVAIISKLREKGCHIVATTHYAEMKMYALQTDGVENASCEFDVVTLRPTYRLLIGTPGRSNAFAISQRLGLTGDIIEHAQELVSTENQRFEDVVSSLETTRYQLDQERLQAQNLRQQAAQTKLEAEQLSKEIEKEKEQIIQDAQSRARTILERTRFHSERIMDELEELKKQKDQAQFSQRFSRAQSEVRSQIDALQREAKPVIKRDDDYQLPRELKSGDPVFLVDFNSEGTVLSAPDKSGNVRVQAGILETRVPVDSVRLLDKDKVTFNGGSVSTHRARPTPASNGNGGDLAGKVDLRGMDSLEADMELDRFIDQSVMSGLNKLTIVHGKGTGVLRDMVTTKLRTHPQIAKYRLGEYGEGGDGVTIAELK